VEDLGSHNGTLVNGRQVSKPTQLDFGDDVLLGDTHVILAPAIANDGQTCQRCGALVADGEDDGAQEIGGKVYCGSCLARHVVPGRQMGHYQALERIGRGGMAEVWAARDERTAHTVALKVLLEPEKVSAQSKQRFLNEAAAGSRLRHEGLVPIYEQGEAEGIPFIAMEYVRGVSLAKRLDEERKIERNEAIQLAIDLARTLAYAHDKHVIHRDVKPANVVLDERSGVARLLDLGVVKVQELEESKGLTRTGTGLGTLEYAPPEQIADAKRVDHRADIYSLGATLYRMVCGHRPFSGGSPMEIARAIMNKAVPWSEADLAAAGPMLQTIINRCMAKHPKDRYDSTHDLVDALEMARG
jgi:serine/threonine protein kinase